MLNPNKPAFPSVTPDGFGEPDRHRGLSKFEWAAVHIAASLASDEITPFDQIAEKAADLAFDVLTACNKRY